MKNRSSLRFYSSLLLLSLVCAQFALGQRAHFPPAGDWERRTPDQANIDPAKLKEAIDFAIASEARGPRSQELGLTQSFGQAPFGELIGPTKDRGDITGIVIRNGYLVAEWGDPLRVDMTHSVTKSFLSTVVGLAFDRKLIRSLQDKAINYNGLVSAYQPGQRFDTAERFGSSSFIDLFATDHNRKITWEHLLRQTSDWEGTLWASLIGPTGPTAIRANGSIGSGANQERFTSTTTFVSTLSRLLRLMCGEGLCRKC